MLSAFISYRRTDSAALATLIAVQLKEKHGIDAYVDTRNTDGGGPFPDRLRGAIERADVFVCLLGATTLESAWVQIEIEHAHNLRKTMIPVFQERYVAPSPIPNEHIEALLQSDGVQFLDVRNLYIDQAIAQLAEMIRNSVPYPAPTITPFYRHVPFVIIVLAIVIAILALIIYPSLNPPRSAVVPTTGIALNPTDTFAPLLLKDTAISAPTLTPSPTLEIAFIVQTLDSEATIEQATLDVQSTAAARTTAYAVGTQSLLDQTATATLWTATPTPNITASIEAYRTQQAATATSNFLEGLTATATLWTSTPTSTVTLSPTPIPLGFPGNPITQNAIWKRVYQTFNYVEMTLVPAGCFIMGSLNGPEDEKPIYRQCFDKPFWIDRYEVTNKQFGSSGFFTGDKRPRESVTWFEARNFCVNRGARLPTEREWEYAARGPDNLFYPWGNDFVAANVVYSENSNKQTANVGSRPAGNSWVGASDLSGNVWEWVSSIYKPYPYKADDVREMNSDRIDVVRVLRGGSFVDIDYYVRAAFRDNSNVPSDAGKNIGFRCARDY